MPDSDWMSRYLIALNYLVFYFVMSFCLGCGLWEFLLTRQNMKGKGEEGKGNRMKPEETEG